MLTSKQSVSRSGLIARCRIVIRHGGVYSIGSCNTADDAKCNSHMSQENNWSAIRSIRRTARQNDTGSTRGCCGTHATGPHHNNYLITHTVPLRFPHPCRPPHIPLTCLSPSHEISCSVAGSRRGRHLECTPNGKCTPSITAHSTAPKMQFAAKLLARLVCSTMVIGAAVHVAC